MADTEREAQGGLRVDDGRYQLEKPLNFDPFGHARFAHLFVLYD